MSETQEQFLSIPKVLWLKIAEELTYLDVQSFEQAARLCRVIVAENELWQAVGIWRTKGLENTQVAESLAQSIHPHIARLALKGITGVLNRGFYESQSLIWRVNSATSTAKESSKERLLHFNCDHLDERCELRPPHTEWESKNQAGSEAVVLQLVHPLCTIQKLHITAYNAIGSTQPHGHTLMKLHFGCLPVNGNKYWDTSPEEIELSYKQAVENGQTVWHEHPHQLALLPGRHEYVIEHTACPGGLLKLEFIREPKAGDPTTWPVRIGRIAACGSILRGLQLIDKKFSPILRDTFAVPGQLKCYSHRGNFSDKHGACLCLEYVLEMILMLDCDDFYEADPWGYEGAIFDL